MRQTEVGIQLNPRIGISRRPHIADGGGDIFNVLVPAGPTEHGVLVEGIGDVFDGLELEPVTLDFFPQSDQVAHVPATLAGEVRRVELNAAHAQLAGEGQVLVGGPSGLTDPDPHCHK